MLEGENPTHRQEDTGNQKGKQLKDIRTYGKRRVLYYKDGTYSEHILPSNQGCKDAPTTPATPNANNSLNQQGQDTKTQ